MSESLDWRVSRGEQVRRRVRVSTGVTGTECLLWEKVSRIHGVAADGISEPVYRPVVTQPDACHRVNGLERADRAEGVPPISLPWVGQRRHTMCHFALCCIMSV